MTAYESRATIRETVCTPIEPVSRVDCMLVKLYPLHIHNGLNNNSLRLLEIVLRVYFNERIKYQVRSQRWVAIKKTAKA